MAWTVPKTWVADELVDQLDLNTYIRDNMLILKTPMDDTGKIIAIDSTRFANLSGTNLTGVAKLASNNDFTAGKQNFNAGSGTRLVLPVGLDKWAT